AGSSARDRLGVRGARRHRCQRRLEHSPTQVTGDSSMPLPFRFLSHKSGRSIRRDRRAKRMMLTARPEVLRLEDRTLPSTVTWINPGSGDWNTASNWSSGAVPGAADDVVINVPGITVTHGAGI